MRISHLISILFSLNAFATPFSVPVPISSTSICALILAGQERVIDGSGSFQILKWGRDNSEILSHLVRTSFVEARESLVGDTTIRAAIMRAGFEVDSKTQLDVLVREYRSNNRSPGLPDLYVWATTDRSGRILLGITFHYFLRAQLEAVLPVMEDLVRTKAESFSSSSWVSAQEPASRIGRMSQSFIVTAGTDPALTFTSIGELSQSVNQHIAHLTNEGKFWPQQTP